MESYISLHWSSLLIHSIKSASSSDSSYPPSTRHVSLVFVLEIPIYSLTFTLNIDSIYTILILALSLASVLHTLHPPLSLSSTSATVGKWNTFFSFFSSIGVRVEPGMPSPSKKPKRVINSWVAGEEEPGTAGSETQTEKEKGGREKGKEGQTEHEGQRDRTERKEDISFPTHEQHCTLRCFCIVFLHTNRASLYHTHTSVLGYVHTNMVNF